MKTRFAWNNINTPPSDGRKVWILVDMSDAGEGWFDDPDLNYNNFIEGEPQVIEAHYFQPCGSGIEGWITPEGMSLGSDPDCDDLPPLAWSEIL